MKRFSIPAGPVLMAVAVAGAWLCARPAAKHFEEGRGAPLLAACAAAEPAGPKAADAGTPEGVIPNDMCHICHIPFADEKLAAVHAKTKVWCRDCHGPSAAHMADENIGATRPDRVYAKDRVDAMCGKCHDKTDHPKVTAEVRAVRLAESKKAQEKVKERRVEVRGVCTDCHGEHWIPPKQAVSRRRDARRPTLPSWGSGLEARVAAGRTGCG